MSKEKFYREGIRFECQGTGRCCTSRGENGFVYLTSFDQDRMSRALKLPHSEFLEKYCDETDGHWHLKNPEQDCPFLDGKRCRIYEGRPQQCRTWPFWPENMNSKTWNQEIVPFCAGIGKGRIYSYDEIQDILKLDTLDSNADERSQ